MNTCFLIFSAFLVQLILLSQKGECEQQRSQFKKSEGSAGHWFLEHLKQFQNYFTNLLGIDEDSCSVKVNKTKTILDSLLAEVGGEVSPFQIGWYNDLISKDEFLKHHYSMLPYKRDTVAFSILTNGSWFDKVFFPYIKQNCAKLGKTITQPIDQINSQHVLNTLMKSLLGKHFLYLKNDKATSDIDFIADDGYMLKCFQTDSGSLECKDCNKCLGYVNVQKAAWLARSVGYYYTKQEKLCRFPQCMSTSLSASSYCANYRFGTALHPKLGGWFRLNGIFVIPSLKCKSLKQPKEKRVLPRAGIEQFLDTSNNECTGGVLTPNSTEVDWRNFNEKGISGAKQFKYSKQTQDYLKIIDMDVRIQTLKDTFCKCTVLQDQACFKNETTCGPN